MPSPNTKRLFPAPPQTHAIKDPEARNAIEALIAAHNVRNGIIGSGDNAFITKADVQAMIDDSVTAPVQQTSIASSGNEATTAPTDAFSRYVQLTNEPVDPLAGEALGWGADIFQNRGISSVVGGHFHVISSGNHIGNVWGFATEAYNDAGKIGGQETQLFGGEVSIINMIPNSIAWRHAGLLVVFKNRLDVQNFPQLKPAGTVLNPGESYNRNSSALFIDAGAGRIGSSSDLTKGNANIPCGWQRGIHFNAHSLDESTPFASDAVGIDFTALENFAPESANRRQYQRLAAAIALPPNTPITWDGSGKQVKTQFNAATGFLEFKVGQYALAGINFSDGSFSVGATSNYGRFRYTLALADVGTELLHMASGSRVDTSQQLGNYTYVGMINIMIDGSVYKLPFYH